MATSRRRISASWIAAKLEEKILALGPDNVASFSAEPVHGAGGLIFPPSTYWPAIQKVCAKYDVLLHVDEVITGFGRTGNWFGSHTYGISPDVMTMAKGLSSGYQPISAIALGRGLCDRQRQRGAGARLYLFRHPVASAVALKNLEIMERDKILACVGATPVPIFRTRCAPSSAAIIRWSAKCGVICWRRSSWSTTRPSGASSRKSAMSARSAAITASARACHAAIRDTMVCSPPLTITHAEIIRRDGRLAKRCFDPDGSPIWGAD